MKRFITKQRIFCISVILAIIIVPFLYSYFYLGAFWDPYSKLDKLPVAVVNEDKGAEIHGANRNLGNEFCDRLRKDASLKFVFTDAKEARKGTEGHKYYAIITIPEEFSANIASVGSQKKQTAVITFAANEKRNFLASQILNRAVLEMEEETRGSIDKEIVNELADKIKEVPGQLTDLKDGLDKLSNGSTELTDGVKNLSVGSHDLSDGTASLLDGADNLTGGINTYYRKLGLYKEGVTSLKDGLTALVDGTGKLGAGVGQLKTGTDLLVDQTKDIAQISTGAKKVAEGTKTFDTNLVQYTNGVNSLINSVNSTAGFLTQYVKANPALMKDPAFAAFISKLSDPSAAQNMIALQTAGTQLTAAHTQLVAGTQQLQAGSAGLVKLNPALVSLSEGMSTVQKGASSLSLGVTKLSKGSADLNTATNKLYAAAGDIKDGAVKLDNGLSKVNDGAQKLNSGVDELSTGANELKDGINKAKDGVDSSIADANEQIGTLSGMAEYAAEPVSIKQENITSIANYGTAFAPYFMSLSLWVGALILFVGIYLDTEGKFKILSRESNHKAARSFMFLIIGLVQAIALGLVVKNGLGLKVDNTVLFFASLCLVSMVFISIVQFLMVHFRSVGKLLSVVLLILQLTSCGGTFPMETVPKLFNVLYPYMPMTYSVSLFKQAITDTDSDAVLYNCGVLFSILVVFMALTIILSAIKSRRAIKAKLQLPVQFE